MKRRASDAPLFDKCPAAAHGSEDEVRLNRVDEYGALGTAVHKACAAIVEGGEADTGALAAQYALSEPAKIDMIRMIAAFHAWWAQNMHLFPRAASEIAMRTETLSGHADIVSLNDEGTVLRIADVKTTRLENVDYLPQGMEYLWLGARFNQFKTAERFQFVQVFVRDWTASVSQEFTRADLDAWHDDLEQRLEHWDGRTYNPGGHCWYCGRCATCPGLNHELATITPDLNHVLQDGIDKISDARCVDLWDQIGVALKFLNRARELIKLRAVGYGGRTIIGAERDLVLTEQTRRHLRPMAAWPVLKQYVTDPELEPAVKISKDVALAAVAAKAPRGAKGKVKKKVEAELEAADAFTTETVLLPKIVPSRAASNEAQIEGA
jgi:hypothetical protein